MLFCLPPDLGSILVHLQMFWAVPQLCGLWIKSVWMGAAAGLARDVIVVIRGHCGGTCLLLLLSTLLVSLVIGVQFVWGSCAEDRQDESCVWIVF